MSRKTKKKPVRTYEKHTLTEIIPVKGESELNLAFMEAALRQMVASFKPAIGPRFGPGRPRILPSFALWNGLIICVMRGFTTQSEVWRLLRDKGLWTYQPFNISDDAVYKRLQTEGSAYLEQLFEHIKSALRVHLTPFTQSFNEQLPLAPFASGVYALDVTSLDKVKRSLPSLRKVANGDDLLYKGKLACLFNVRAQQWEKIKFIETIHENEKISAREMIDGLPDGSLVLADLGYFSFKWFDDLTDKGLFYVSRVREKVTYTIIYTFYEGDCGEFFDGVVWLGNNENSQAKHAVRLVRFCVGQIVYTYITNVLNPLILSMSAIATIYARRWDIEMAFNLGKTHLKLHLIWSAHLNVILAQIWAVLIVSQIIQALRVEIAARAGVSIFDVSLELLIKEAPELARLGIDPVKRFVDNGRVLRYIRPSSRTEIKTPTINEQLIKQLPRELILEREAHYAPLPKSGRDKSTAAAKVPKTKAKRGGQGRAKVERAPPTPQLATL